MNRMPIALIAALALAASLSLIGCSDSGESQDSAQANVAESASASGSEAVSSSATGTASTENASSQGVADNEASVHDSYIGEDVAKAKALEHAGIAEADTTGLKVELDTDDAVAHYEVEFVSAGMEYDYDIDASSGEILASSAETDN